MTAITTDKMVSKLNILIDTCKNGEKGFREAAEGLNNAYYQVRLNEYARHRATFASELQGMVRKLGADPDRKGTIAGTLHRSWMNLKAAIAHGDNDAILDECCRGEETAIYHYEDALKCEWPPEIRAALERHYHLICESRQRLMSMET